MLGKKLNHMPSRSDLPGKINRKKFAKALTRLGFDISKKGGKGSHWKATHISTQKCVIIPSKIDRNVLYYLLKEIKIYSSVEWDDIKDKL